MILLVTYFYELENVSREYMRGKLEMTSDYMKAWLDKDATLMREVNQQLELIKMNRDSAYMDVVNRMMEKGRLEEVLVKAKYAVDAEENDRAELGKGREIFRQVDGRVGFVHENVYAGLRVLFLLLPVRVAGTD